MKTSSKGIISRDGYSQKRAFAPLRKMMRTSTVLI